MSRVHASSTACQCGSSPSARGSAAHFLTAVLLQLSSLAAAAPQPAADARYEIRDDVLIRMEDGATLSATVVLPRPLERPLPTLFTLDIYTDPEAFRARGRDAVDHGYAAVIADTRGKRLSPGPAEPYEHEAADAYAVIDWIAHQPWSDGQVGMRGGSYSGFTAWAATKRLHPALKTLAVSAAAIPGQGLPMCNNIFLTANYAWAFYVGDNKYLDTATYEDSARWERLPGAWFASGRPYREIDAVDGRPNPWLQRWLLHPDYDRYWQDMVPYRGDFARINLPVLTITGYYDDAQLSALGYLRQHMAYNPHAEHFLVIGPYDHFGTHWSTKPAVLRGYPIDPAAQFSTPELVYAWMDYVLRGGPKPAMLRDRINYEVMGLDEWRHVATLAQMSSRQLALYFSTVQDGTRYRLLRSKPPAAAVIEQRVDFADRAHFTNMHQYPDPIIEERLGETSELVFAGEPFTRPTVLSGAFTGELIVTLNKRDADFGVTVFEQQPDGRLFHLAYWLGRASYSADARVRQLLTPGKAAAIRFETTVTSRRFKAGSRLLVLLDVNKNPYAQVNYGTGKDVSDESVADATRPLRVQYHTGSYLNVPLE